MPDRLIESMRMVDGRIPLWPLHSWRLLNSALVLGLPLPEVIEPVGGPDRMVRLEVGADGVEVTDRELPPSNPISLVESPAPHRGYSHKTTARAWLEAARATSRTGGADDALLFDAEGRLIEATRFAVGWWDGEVLCFPPLALGGLRSVARTRLLEMARQGVREAVISRGELGRRSFVACNAVRGIVDVEMLNGTPLAPNPRTEALARRFWERPQT